MSPAAPKRPQKVTMACILTGVTSLILLISMATTLTNWASFELTEAVSDAIAQPPLEDLGLDLDQALSWLRVLLLAVAGLAAAGVVLAVYAFRGHQPSRIILTVLAVVASLAFMASGVMGIVYAAFCVLAAAYFWSYEARVWFAAKNGKPGPAPRVSAPPRPVVTAGAPAHQSQAPAEPALPPAAPAPYPPYDAPAPMPQQPPAQRLRPAAVMTAVLTTLIASGIVAATTGLLLLSYLASPSEFARLLEDNPMMRSRDILDQLSMTAAELARWIAVGSFVLAVVSTIAFGAGILTLLGRREGPRLLLVMSVVTVPLGAVLLPVGLLWSAAAVVVIVCLRRPDVKAWFAPSR